ncbi:MAG: ABC transporter ATP-binding protein, partial [Angelakisella sp.]
NNGAGKSTFFLLANGVLLPKTGQIYLKNEAIGHSRKELNKLRRTVGLVFQDPEVQILAGTVEEEISFGPVNLGLADAEVLRRVNNEIEKFDLEAFRMRAPQYLSGGEKKRVTLADVLAMQPEIILLDEPTASLDCTNLSLLEQNLEKLSRHGLALAVATHDMDFVWRWAERVIVLCGGHLMADDTPEVIFADEALLESCGLSQPMLYKVGKALGMTKLPRRVEELNGVKR